MDRQADVAGRANVLVPWPSRIRNGLDLVGEVARLRRDLPTVLEHGAPGDSQSNGFVERAFRPSRTWIHAGVRVAGDAQGHGQGRRRDAGALGGLHVVRKSFHDPRTLGGQEVGRSRCQDSGRA